jgi:dolichyl-diphosphooligosaccharide--protein glycosyltransferase
MLTLNDVCCLMPCWFGALATFFTGMLAVECSTNRGNFGTVLDQLLLVGGYSRKVGNYIRGLGVYLGMEDAASSNADANGTSIFSTTPLFVGLATIFFMSIVPAHLMRSVGGGFDNESVAVTAMVLVFYLWTRSLRDSNSSSSRNNNISIISPAIGGAIAGLAYFNMVAAWGGYVFVINLIGVHTAILILLGRHSSKLHAAYTAFYSVGTALATTVPVVGWTPLKSLEQLGPCVVFLGIQLVEYCERVRIKKKLSTGKAWLLRLRVFGMAAILGAAVVVVLYPTGYFGPISSRVRGLFVKHTKTGNPLVDSVAEHQAAKPEAYEQYLGLLTKLAPVGFGMVAIAYSNDASSFLLVYGVATYFFSHKMVRLILLTAPIACVFGGIVVGRVAGFCVEGVLGMRLDAADIPSLIFEKEMQVEATVLNGDRKDIDAKKKKKPKADAEKEATPANEEKTSIRNNLFYLLVIKGAWLYLAYYLYQRAQPYKKEFQDKCRELSYGLSHPSILFQANTQQGVVTVDDYREAYWWLRDNTPEDARIMAWWDYGYQITAIANRTTIAVSF